MTAAAHPRTAPSDPELPHSDRRSAADRRSEPQTTRRGGLYPRKRPLWKLGRDLLIGASAIAAIVVAVHFSHPIFANRPTVVAGLTKAVPATKAALDTTAAISATPDTGRLALIVQSP